MKNVSRRPPIRLHDVPAGRCRWCGDAILYPEAHKRAGEPNLRRNWHPECAQAFKLHSWPAEQRAHVWARQRGICQGCGLDLGVPTGFRFEQHGVVDQRHRDSLSSWPSWRPLPRGHLRCSLVMPVFPAWHCDHVVPLWSVDREAPDALRHWGPDNLQLLCEPCHAAKTAAEAGERARQRSPQLSLGLGELPHRLVREAPMNWP